MYLKDIIDKKIAVNCRNEEEVKKLFDYAKENCLENCQSVSELIYWWRTFKENTCYHLYLRSLPVPFRLLLRPRRDA